ncbi:MAG: toprim domain-containing protein, partial [Rhodovibrionaceae bacterium]
AAHETGEVVAAEGYMDVIALCQAGFEAAVAPLGTAMTEEQLAELWRLAPEPTLCLDGDQAGQKAAFRAMERALPLLQPGRSLRFALLPQGEDPDSLLQSQGPGALRGVLSAAKPLSELLWMRETQGKSLDTPERRAGLRQSLERAVREIQDPSVQEAYRLDVRRRFDEAYGRAFAQRNRWQGGRGRPFGGRQAGGQGGAQVLGLPAPGSRMPPGLLPRRNEQAVLAAAINHPAVLQDHLEDLVRAQLSSADLEALRGALVDLLAEQPDLDSDAIKGHLRQQGYSGLLDSLLSRNVYDLSTFAHPSATPEWVREGWRHGLELIRERLSREETVEATRQLAESMDEADLNRLESKKRLTQEGEARRVDLDKYDPASRNG